MEPIQRGDIVLAKSRLKNGVVLVTGIYDKHFNAVLIHTMPELATDADVSFPHGEVLPYPIVVQFDLYGCFLPSQAARVLGHLEVPPLPLDPYAAARIFAAHHNARRGLPIRRGTERWDWKIEQLDQDLRPLVYPFWQGFKW
jgi:hypothetical protein